MSAPWSAVPLAAGRPATGATRSWPPLCPIVRLPGTQAPAQMECGGQRGGGRGEQGQDYQGGLEWVGVGAQRLMGDGLDGDADDEGDADEGDGDRAERPYPAPRGGGRDGHGEQNHGRQRRRGGGASSGDEVVHTCPAGTGCVPP